MSQAQQQRLKLIANRTGWIVVGFIIIQAITGILMSMYYVPSDAPARTVDGKPLTISQSLRLDTIGTFIDTLNVLGRTALVPARQGELVPSMASASVHVALENAPLGSFIRAVHQHAATALVLTSLFWAALLGFAGAYASNPRLWLMSIGVSVLALALAWTGRVLPDDVYSMISRTIVSNELRDAPLGDFITRVLGLHYAELSLSRTYIMHALVMGGGICLLPYAMAKTLGNQAPREPRVRTLGYCGIAFVASVLLAVANPVHEYPIRDAIKGVAGGEHVYAWWTIMPIHAWAIWLGAELAGFIAIALLLKLVTMPLWHSAMRPSYAKTLVALVSGAIVLAYMFGN
ncbi:MAG: hypothetical protein FJ211_00100 [Ignavibacteria bacterium]|nr:hypothetical protein [Ignavibacteria bacterium]